MKELSTKEKVTDGTKYFKFLLLLQKEWEQELLRPGFRDCAMFFVENYVFLNISTPNGFLFCGPIKQIFLSTTGAWRHLL